MKTIINLALCIATCALLAACSPRFKNVSLQSEITEVQPMTGLTLSPVNDELEAYSQAIALEDVTGVPCRVVVGKADGQIIYDWTWLDSVLNAVAARGHQAVVRFRYEYPGNHSVDGKEGTTGVPQYIKELPDYHEFFYHNPNFDGGDTYYADWTNEELKWFTKQFYADLAARYDADPRFAFLELGFGHWGEYHIYATPLHMGVNFPSKEYQAEFLQFADSVITMPWAISIDAADPMYTPIVASPELMALNFGLFDDSFMHRGHELSSGIGDNETNWIAIGGDHWKHSVCGGEVSYYTHKDQQEFLNPEGLYGVTWEEAIAKYHITFMNSNDAPGPYGTVARFREAGIASGYYFTVLSCKTNDRETRLVVTNEGVAPVYYDAFFAVGEVRSEQSLKGLLPGEKLEVCIPAGLTEAETLHIACDYILPSQHIDFKADL